MTFDTRILSGHVGGGALWVVRRGPEGTATRLHRFVDGVEVGVTDLDSGIVSDAAGDASGLWVATGGPEAIHLDAATGAVDRRLPVADAEWLDVGEGTLVVAGPPSDGAGTDLTVADAATGGVHWSTVAPDPDWTRLQDVGWLDERAWLAHFELEDGPDDVRGGLAAVDASGEVVGGHDLELRYLRSLGDRLLGITEPLSARQPFAPAAVLVGPASDRAVGTPLGRDDDLVGAAPAVADGSAWVPVHVAGDGPRVIEVRPDGTTPTAVRLPVPDDQLLEWVAVVDGDLWFASAGPDIGPDGDLPTTLWRLPGAAG